MRKKQLLSFTDIALSEGVFYISIINGNGTKKVGCSFKEFISGRLIICAAHQMFPALLSGHMMGLHFQDLE